MKTTGMRRGVQKRTKKSDEGERERARKSERKRSEESIASRLASTERAPFSDQDDQDDDGEFEGERRRKDEKWFREHVRRCSCGGRPVVPGINTAFNVGRRRSWTRSPQGASLLVAPGARLPRRASSRLSLPVIAPDPTPRPPPTEGSLLFLRSAIRR